MPDIAAGLGGIEDPALGVAVSGGSDSTALLCLAQDWANAQGRCLAVVTVDHGLRAESAAEALAVADLARRLGVDHSILRWGGWDGSGNLQDVAREARISLIAEWAKARGLRTVLMGHTRDDQAETVLMRLARGSGVDGLAGMAARASRAGVHWVRPLLDASRADLRAWLRERGVDWIEDPSNDDPRFARVQLREAREVLEGLGLTTERLAGTAQSMARARVALEDAALRLGQKVARPLDIGAVDLARSGLWDAPEELRLRLLANALQWVGGAVYRPRLSALTALDADVGTLSSGRRTLMGCVIDWSADQVFVSRELAHSGPGVPSGAVWDGRWNTQGPEGLIVRALGSEGLSELSDWRSSGYQRVALEASPAFWQNDALVAAPFAMPDQRCHVHLKDGAEGFFKRLAPALKTR